MMEIRTHSIFEIFRFPDIQNIPMAIIHQVNSGRFRELLEFCLNCLHEGKVTENGGIGKGLRGILEIAKKTAEKQQSYPEIGEFIPHPPHTYKYSYLGYKHPILICRFLDQFRISYSRQMVCRLGVPHRC